VSISCLFRLAESCLGVKFARLDTTTRHFLAFGPVLNSLDDADRSRLSTPLVECILMLAGRVPLMFLMCSHVTPLIVLSVRLSDDRALAADHDYLSLSLSLACLDFSSFSLAWILNESKERVPAESAGSFTDRSRSVNRNEFSPIERLARRLSISENPRNCRLEIRARSRDAYLTSRGIRSTSGFRRKTHAMRLTRTPRVD